MRSTQSPTTRFLCHGAEGLHINDIGLRHPPENLAHRCRVLTRGCNRESLRLLPMRRSSSKPPLVAEASHPNAFSVRHCAHTLPPSLRQQARDHSKFLSHTRRIFQATWENLIQMRKRDIANLVQVIPNFVGLIRLYESARKV